MREEVLHKIIESQKDLVNNIKKAIATYESTTDLDKYDTIDLDDQSHQADLQEMEMELEQKLIMKEKDLARILSLEKLSCKSVEKGAVIATHEAIFFIGFTFAPIDFDERKILGISLQAPVFVANQGKVKGEYLVLGNTQQEIIGIY